jgi:hypothetical protein
MSTLVWDKTGERIFESGVRKGVLYEENGDGIAWNGLTSVQEGSDMQVEPVYFDGVKFNDIVTIGDFSAVLHAFTYPDEFLFYEGTIKDQTGFYITGQPTTRFGLSYQTLIGDDIEGLEAGYKIHILYNLTAVPSDKTYETLSLDTTPVEFEWTISSVPEEIANFRPTAHVILNSLEIDPDMLKDIEGILYGSEDNEPHLPSLQSLATFIRQWNRFIVTDNGDGTWTADDRGLGYIVMLDADTFEITSDTAEFIDADSYTIESSEKNEGDIWLP